MVLKYDIKGKHGLKCVIKYKHGFTNGDVKGIHG